MIAFSYRIEGGDFDSAGLATRKLKEQLSRIGVGAPAMRRAMIAAYEAEMNVVIHARTGTLWARLDSGRLDLEIADEGPGIADVGLALREGWSTASERARQMGFGAGMGLPNIRRSSDRFDIETRVGRGTRIRSTILLDGPGRGDTLASDSDEGAAAPSLDGSRCSRCMRCLHACPVSALRVGKTGPSVIRELCIGCTECLSGCSEGVFGLGDGGKAAAAGTATASAARGAAGLVVPDDAVLVLSRGFLSGLPVDGGPTRVAAALPRLGFREVRFLEDWTESLRASARIEARARADGARARADVMRAPRGAHVSGAAGGLPLITPICPAVIALVEGRFPSLIPMLGAWLSPAEAAGEEFPLRPVVLVAACPGQHAAARRASLTDRLTVISPARLADAVRPLLSAGSDADAPSVPPGAVAAAAGAAVGAELFPEAMTVRGPRHVLRVLAEAEAGRLPGVSLLDLFLCEGGCSGSPLLTADWYLSDRRWQECAGQTCARPAGGAAGAGPADATAVARSRPYSQRLGVRLDADMGKAIEKLARIDALARALPGRDCAACGAPTCSALAEDLVLERACGATCPHAEDAI